MTDAVLREAERALLADDLNPTALLRWADLVARAGPRSGAILTPDQLDTLHDLDFDLKKLVGIKVQHHIFGRGPLALLRTGEVGIKLRIKCGVQRCDRRTTLYFVSGVHHGAYCYATDLNGASADDDDDALLIDYRNQYWVCNKRHRRSQ